MSGDPVEFTAASIIFTIDLREIEARNQAFDRFFVEGKYPAEMRDALWLAWSTALAWNERGRPW